MNDDADARVRAAVAGAPASPPPHRKGGGPGNAVAALYAQWMAIPAPIREPVKSAVVSFAYGMVTAISTLGSAYFVDHPYDWHGFFLYLLTPHAVGACAAAIAVAHRVRQARARVANTVVTDSGAVAVVLKPPADGTRYPVAPNEAVK